MPVAKIPSRMSGSEVLGCVELVTAAFAEASDLTGTLCRKQKRRKGDRDFHELLLFQVLEQGARSVQKAYDDGFSNLGSIFKVGDDEARERLLCIAIEMNAEVVQPLMTACSSDKPTPDLTKLHEAAITARHDAVRSLGALRRRLDHLRPLALSKFSPDSSVCGDEPYHAFSTDAPPPPPEKSGLRRMLSVSTNASHRRIRSEGPAVHRPPLSPTHSVAPSIVIPAPLSINTPPPQTPNPNRSSMISTRTWNHQRSKSEVQSKRTSSHRLESLQHPDMPNFALKADIATKRTSSNRLEALQHPDMPNYAMSSGPRPKSSKHNRRDSLVSVARSTASSSTTSPRPSSTYTLQSIPYESTHPDHTTPPIPHFPTIHHAALAPVTSPIAEVPDVSPADYDAESVYSQHDSDPGTPVTDSGSSDRHSGSEARTPTTETSTPLSSRGEWLGADEVKTYLPPRSGLSFRKRASTVESKWSTGSTTPSSTEGDAGRKKWGWHRYSRSTAEGSPVKVQEKKVPVPKLGRDDWVRVLMQL
ncbi:hypothetical protein K461DRAFT_325172 [Myriangium duriaei CBS 260.36]|uniref:Uncharacterized protein n=1 Tax=Myriangium duriaei CBS 260.36 TaxID=1168546 RepID=A0A9P4IQB8_9PEZI|nr:hypothetical protein K461DRAFT_325172 [Myriangium duriaei CBS 260.36]